MKKRVERRTVDLSRFPDLVVIYLGMRVNAPWGGTGFWHETYFMRGGMEAIYDDMIVPIGFERFAPVQPARGSMFSARRRLHLPGESPDPTPVPEEALPGGDGPSSAGTV